MYVCTGHTDDIAVNYSDAYSGSHAIVGSTMGFSFVKYGYHGIKWLRIVRIVASWFVSPVLAGAISGFMFILVRRFILMSSTPMESGEKENRASLPEMMHNKNDRITLIEIIFLKLLLIGLRGLPVFYAVSIFINSISIFLGGAIQQIPGWGAVIISVGLAVITGLVVHFWVVPWKRRTILQNIGKLRAKTAIPLICGMNVSTATSLNMLDEEWVGRVPAVPLNYVQNFGTSTTSLDMLGDAEKIVDDDQRSYYLPPAEFQQHDVLHVPLKYDRDEEKLPPMRRKSVHTYKIAGHFPAPNFSIGNKASDSDSI